MYYKNIDVDKVVVIAEKAGEEIMQIYARDFEVEKKADNSPLTEADKKSNTVIIEGLQTVYPDIPFISEETKQTPYEERKHWKRFWLIDPLDGTKEFIKKNGEFTVNIALIEEGIPVVGVVYVPVQKISYLGVKGSGSYKRETRNSKPGTLNPELRIQNNIHYSEKQKVVVVASRSHLTDETVRFIEGLKAQGKEVEFISSGSSLKICLVAEGKADVYPRFGPTMEWDTAAAHAVALYAGKQVVKTEDHKPLIYNKENLLNPNFIVE